MTQETILAVIAVTNVALVGILVFMLIQVRRTMREARELLAEVRAGFRRASVLLQAAGDLGESFQGFQRKIQSVSGGWMTNLMAMGIGIRAASAVFRRRTTAERSFDHEKQRNGD